MEKVPGIVYQVEILDDGVQSFYNKLFLGYVYDVDGLKKELNVNLYRVWDLDRFSSKEEFLKPYINNLGHDSSDITGESLYYDICLGNNTYRTEQELFSIDISLEDVQKFILENHSVLEKQYERNVEWILELREIKNYNDIKQVIVIRKDLKCRRGKEIVQGCHASNMFLMWRLGTIKKGASIHYTLSEVEELWLEGNYKKICVTVDSESELDRIYEEARLAGLEVNMVTDLGLTEFKKPTKTCLAIGPDYSEKIDKITGKLPLY